MTSFGYAPPSRPALNPVYPPYSSHGYGPHPPVQYAPPPAAHAPFPHYPDSYYAPYYSPYSAPLPAAPDAPPLPYLPVYAPIQYSTYFSQQSTNFQQAHVANPPPQTTALHSYPPYSSTYLRKYSDTSNTPSTTDFQTSLNHLPRKLQVAVNHVANTELPAAANQVAHVAKNLTALVVIKRGKRAKYRAKRRFGADGTESESSLAEEDSADEYGNHKPATLDNSPTFKHKCRMENCTRSFATLRLLQKHQTTKHPESSESVLSTPVSQHELLTPKGSRKKQKLSMHGDVTPTKNEVQTVPPIDEPNTVQTAAPIDEPKAESSDKTQIPSETEQALQDEEETTKPTVSIPRNRDFDDEDLNDDE
ncbi:hypothetical protein HDU81_010021 [Chytriomyces hyalinus]|nr:hypothetical protein HDU81_010021 [Chytriomyces hyalinus]